MKNIYCAIIGDIIRSRDLVERKPVQEKFQKGIKKINEEFKSEIVSQFLITLGDEFQGVLLHPEKSVDLIDRFEELIHPVNFVYGVGIGEITTKIYKFALGMDGSAFHRARSALEQAKKGPQRTFYLTENAELDEIVNTLLFLIQELKKHWTPRQFEVVSLYQKIGSQKKVAEQLQIVPSVVSETLISAHAVPIFQAKEVLKKLLAREFGKRTE